MKYLLIIFIIILFGCVVKDEVKDNDDNKVDTPFFKTLPVDVQNDILWYCDFEDASFRKWEDKGTDDYNPGGGIFLTDDANVEYGISKTVFHTGGYSGFASIFDAVTPGENKAVRFMRWTDKAWDEDGDYFPDEAYYSVFMKFADLYDPAKPVDNDPLGDGGWWNVFQFKSDNNAGSMPVVALDLYNENGKMYFALVIKDYPDDNSDNHTQEYIVQDAPLEIKSGVWTHVEAFYKKTKDYTGQVVIWQNGKKIFEKSDVRTVLPPAESTTWGVGNYSDYISPGGTATIYYDDAVVSVTAVNGYLP